MRDAEKQNRRGIPDLGFGVIAIFTRLESSSQSRVRSVRKMSTRLPQGHQNEN